MNEKRKILLLIDYRDQFWLKANHKEANFDVPLLKLEFEKLGYNIDVINFSDIDIKNKEYHDTYVIYQSSEDPDHFYKSYIEDCLLGLKLKGAILIPDFLYLRAHDNKVFMEILRDANNSNILKNPVAEYFGTYEDYKKKFLNKEVAPKVLKLSSGAQSKNVFLLKTKNEFKKIPRRISLSFNIYYWFVDKVKPYLKKRYPNYRRKSHNRRKFILQDFVSDLDGDYKVLVYDKDYYVLSRKVKPKDFRASGSGLFQYSKNIPDGMLDYAKKCFESFDVPYMGLDIAEKNGIFYLIEFQFVHFGNYTLEKSPFHFVYQNESWEIRETKVILECEFARAIHKYINKKFENSLHS